MNNDELNYVLSYLDTLRKLYENSYLYALYYLYCLSYDVIVETYFPELSQGRAVGNSMYYVPIYNVSGKVSGWLALSILRHQCKSVH